MLYVRKLLFLIYVWVPEVGNTANTRNPLWVLPQGEFGVSAVLPTSGTQTYIKNL